MCQFSRDCNNFYKNPKNSSQCFMLCARNPLMQLDIPDKFVDKRPKGEHRPDVELEDMADFRPPVLSKLISDVKDKEEKIQGDESLTRGQKIDQIGKLRSEVATQQSHDSEPMDTRDHAKLNVQPLAKALEKTPKKDAQREETAEAVEGSVMINPEAGKLWNVPKRKKKTLGR